MKSTIQLRRNLERLPREAMIPVGWVVERLAAAESNDAAPDDVEIDLTCEEVAKLVQRKPSTVRAWCATGLFPGAWQLNGKQWRIPRTAIMAFQHQQQAKNLPHDRHGSQ